jgi:hypothetical protein
VGDQPFPQPRVLPLQKGRPPLGFFITSRFSA